MRMWFKETNTYKISFIMTIKKAAIKNERGLIRKK